MGRGVRHTMITDTCEARGVCSYHECTCPCEGCDGLGVHTRAHCVDSGGGDCERMEEEHSDAERVDGLAIRWPLVGSSPDVWARHSACPGADR